MKTGIFTAVTVFENRYIYIMAHDCLSLEVLDTERSETMCTILNLKTPLDCQEMMRPILLPLNDTEILYLQSCQDSWSEQSENSTTSEHRASIVSEDDTTSFKEECEDVSENGYDNGDGDENDEEEKEMPFRGDFLFMASAGNNKACPIMCLSVGLQEVRLLSELVGCKINEVADRFSSQ